MISWVVNSRLHLRQTSPRYARAPQSASPRNLRVRRLSRPVGASLRYISLTPFLRILEITKSFPFTLFRTLWRAPKLNPFVSVDYALFTQKHRGGVSRPFMENQNETTTR